mgnify:CR=1 FL=1
MPATTQPPPHAIHNPWGTFDVQPTSTGLRFLRPWQFAQACHAALQQHVFWGSLLAGLVLWGPGRWSVDGSGPASARVQD